MNINKYIILSLINNSKNINNLQNPDGNKINTDNQVFTDSNNNSNYEFIKSENIPDTDITVSTANFSNIVNETNITASFYGLTIDNENIVFNKLPTITAEITGDNENDNSIATTKFVNDKINDLKLRTDNIDTEQFSNNITFNGEITGTTANFSNIVCATGSYSDLVNFNGEITGTTASFSNTITLTKSGGASIICILPEFDTNQLAIDGGLIVGALYRKEGVVRIVI